MLLETIFTIYSGHDVIDDVIDVVGVETVRDRAGREAAEGDATVGGGGGGSSSSNRAGHDGHSTLVL